MKKLPVSKIDILKILTVLTIFSVLSIGAYALSIKDLTIAIDDEEEEIATHSRTVEELLQEKEISLDQDAYINVSLDTKIEDNMNIIIKTAKPYILAIGDRESKIKSVFEKVEDILKDEDIQLGEKDYTKPGLKEEVAANTRIEIYKVNEVIEEIEESIPHQTLVKQNGNMEIGQEKTSQKGQDGLKSIKINKRYENDKLIEESIIDEKIVKEPVPTIIEKGTKKPASKVAKKKEVLTSSRSGRNFRYRKAITMTATAYDLSYESTGKRPGDKYYGITASGTRARVGAVAVDPKVIPLGTKLYVELPNGKDYGYCVAEDTGGAIKGNKIDLFFNSASEVRNFGRRQVKVYILD